ncbi:fimbrial protein [Escherichia coli]|nr:fimbrial protein [Escherichia coli]
MKKLYIRKKIKMVITMFFSILTINVSAAPTLLQTKVTVSIPEPTCSVSAPEKVDMGILTPGMKINWLPDIDVKVNCSGEVAGYVVYMLSQNKQPSSHDGIYLKQGGNDTNILLRLRGSTNNDQFTTDEQNPVSIHEGKGSGMFSHPTKIVIEVPKDAKAGEVTGTVIFKVTYQA